MAEGRDQHYLPNIMINNIFNEIFDRNIPHIIPHHVREVGKGTKHTPLLCLTMTSLEAPAQGKSRPRSSR